MNIPDALRAIAAQIEADDYKPVAAPAQGAMPPEQLAFINAIIGMHRMPDNEATRQRDENLRRHDEEYQRKYWPGNVALDDNLGVRDAAYFAHMSGPYFAKTGQDIRWAGVVGGTTPQINAFIGMGDAWRNNYPVAEYSGPLKVVIAAMMGE